FYRVDNTQTREIGGTGLGLYLCRKLTEAMGGQIWAESLFQQGSTFYVRFPRLDHLEAKELIEQKDTSQPQAIIPIGKSKVPLADNPQPTAAPTPPVAAPAPTPPPQTPPQAPAPVQAQAPQ